jgi:hypothetical protein
MPAKQTPDDEPRQPEIVFGDGTIDEAGDAYIASFLTDPEYADVPHTRMWSYKGGTWLYHDLETVVKSVVRLAKPKPTGYALGRDGVVSIATPSGFSLEEIADAGTGPDKLGYVNRIRHIAGAFYVCGHAGQVYRRAGKEWGHVDEGLLKPTRKAKDAISLYDIHGATADDMYAVGLKGILCHYDGKSWTRLESPTNYHLERVLCASSELVYICGGSEEEGYLFVGNKDDGWTGYHVATQGGFWGLTVFQGVPYVCSQEQLWKLAGDELVQVVPELDPPIWFHRLVSNKEVMWSIGAEDLAVFDGSTWTRIVHPDAA